MKKILLSCSCFILALSCCVPASFAKAPAAKAETAQKRQPKKRKAPTPLSVVADMRAAVVYIAREGKKGLNIKSKQQRPFWGGLKLASKSLDKMEAGIKGRNATMLAGLDGVSRGVELLGTSWGVLRGGQKKNSKIGRGIIALHKSHEFFETHYGPGAARRKKGGSVSPAERAAFVRAQASRKKLVVSLTQLQSKAAKKSLQARLIADLLRQLAGLAQLSADRLDLYCNYLYQWDQFETAFYAYNDCIGVWYPQFYSTWNSVYTETTVISTVLMKTEWSSYSGWDYTTEAVGSCGDYYASTVSVEASEISTSESFLESYEEASATEEVASEVEKLEEGYSADDTEQESFADEAMEEPNDVEETANNEEQAADAGDVDPEVADGDKKMDEDPNEADQAADAGDGDAEVADGDKEMEEDATGEDGEAVAEGDAEMDEAEAGDDGGAMEEADDGGGEAATDGGDGEAMEETDNGEAAADEGGGAEADGAAEDEGGGSEAMEEADDGGGEVADDGGDSEVTEEADAGGEEAAETGDDGGAAGDDGGGAE